MAIIKYYGASCLRHWQMWRNDFCPDRGHATAHWPEIIAAKGLQETSLTARDFRAIWFRDVEDIREADVVVVYCQPPDVMRGALVEAGVGIGFGKQVLLVGPDTVQWGSWQHHPQCLRLGTIEAAMDFIDLMAGS